MSAPSDLGRRPNLAVTSILLANVLPLVGVLWLGWDATILVVLYGLELLVTFPLAGLKALFAQRPPRTDHEDSSVISVSNELTDVRGSVELVSWLPPVYPRNLPFATAVGGSAVGFLMVFGIVLSSVTTVGALLVRPEVLVSALALVVAQSLEMWRDYLREGYKTASPYSVIETPARQTFFLTFVLITFLLIGTSGVGAEGILAAIVLGKLLIEWSAYRATTARTGRLTGWLAGPEPMDAEPDPVAVPEAEPAVRISTDGRGVLYAGILGMEKQAPFLAVSFWVIWYMLIDFVEGTALVTVVNVVFVALFFCALGLGVLMTYLQYGSLEYRRYEDQIVAYDTLLGEPQWSTSISALRDVQVVPDRLADRLTGTRTVAVTVGWGDHERRRYLGPTADPEGLIESFELPIKTTELEPLDRRPAAVIIACLGAVVVGLAVVGPGIAPGELLGYVLFGGVFLWVGLWEVWVRSYPNRTTDPT